MSTDTPRGGTAVDTLDIRLTWAGVVPVLIAGMVHGTTEGRRLARDQFGRMAEIADAAPELLRLARDYLKAVRFYSDVDERNGDDEGARLKRLNATLIEAVIAKAEGRLGFGPTAPTLPVDPLRDAAPDLLAALKRAEFVLASPAISHLVNGAGTLDVVRAAIAKAEAR